MQRHLPRFRYQALDLTALRGGLPFYCPAAALVAKDQVVPDLPDCCPMWGGGIKAIEN